MSYSHKHARRLWRLLCPPALIYTEMLAAEALLYGERRYLLDHAPLPAPLALQLGGSVPDTMAQAAVIGEEAGYQEVNINCGCPSARVKKGAFGACLMQTPERVAEMVAAMKNAVKIPITVKCRIAVDEMDAESGLTDFTAAVVAAGCDGLIVHARRAWLQGLNPAQNRTIPPLDYARVERLKQEFPALPIILNGGLETLEQASAALAGVDGVMLGRAVCRRPYLLAEAAQQFYGIALPEKRQILEQMQAYIATLAEREKRWALSALSGLYHGEANCKMYRQALMTGEIKIPIAVLAG